MLVTHIELERARILEHVEDLSEGQVRRAMSHKFRQINRFLELVNDVVPHLPEGRPIRVVCDYCRSEHNYRGGPAMGNPLGAGGASLGRGDRAAGTQSIQELVEVGDCVVLDGSSLARYEMVSPAV